VSPGDQPGRYRAADIPGRAGDQYPHGAVLLLRSHRASRSCVSTIARKPARRYPHACAHLVRGLRRAVPPGTVGAMRARQRRIPGGAAMTSKALRVLAMLAVAALALVGRAEAAFPDRPITLIVPWAAGGGTDAVARYIGSVLEKELGQPVNVVN